MGQTMEQTVKLGLAFNPLSAADGQGEPFVGNTQNRLKEAMRSNGWEDPRFLTKHQIDTMNWKLTEGAAPVQVTFKTDKGWDNKVLYNATQVEGVPPLDWMLSVAKMRSSALGWEDLNNDMPRDVAAPVEEIETLQREATTNAPQGLPFLTMKNGKTMIYTHDGLTELPADWKGVAVDGGDSKKFWLIGQSDGERSFNALRAKNIDEAMAIADGLVLSPENKAQLDAAREAGALPTKVPDLPSDELGEAAIEDDELGIAPVRRPLDIDLEELVGVSPIFRNKTLGDEGEAHVGEPVVDQMATTLLNTRFKERTPGSGEYHREGEKKVAFFDKGATLVVRDKAADSYQAVMELAKLKGWDEIELNGKSEQKARGWLEAELMGIKVANYVPTEKDLMALDERRALMGLPPADREPKVPEGAKRVTEGRYVGPVVEVTKDYVVQSVGQGQFVAHPISGFAPIPMKDDKLDVAYRDGRVESWLPKVTSQEKGGGRER